MNGGNAKPNISFSSLVRVAGNIASGMVGTPGFTTEHEDRIAMSAVSLARAIIAEAIRTEPVER